MYSPICSKECSKHTHIWTIIANLLQFDTGNTVSKIYCQGYFAQY